VCLSWVFFRASNLEVALEVLHRIGTAAPGEWYGGFRPLYMLGLVLAIDAFGLRARWVELATSNARALRLVTYACVVILAFTFQGASNPEFIYFQF
jgi:hypothetical protein